MRFRPFISGKGNAEPLAKRRRYQVQAAPASGTKKVVAGNERGAGDAHGGKDQIGGISEAVGGELGYMPEHLQRKES